MLVRWLVEVLDHYPELGDLADHLTREQQGTEQTLLSAEIVGRDAGIDTASPCAVAPLVAGVAAVAAEVVHGSPTLLSQACGSLGAYPWGQHCGQLFQAPDSTAPVSYTHLTLPTSDLV